jgi:hypothetical protein
MHERMVEALFRAQDAAGVSRAATAYLAATQGAAFALIATRSVDGTEFVVAANAAVPQSLKDSLGRVSVDAPTILAEASRTGWAQFISEAFRHVVPNDNIASLAVLPLSWPETNGGVLVVGFAERQTFEAALREQLLDGASLIALALEHARMASRDRVAALARQYLDEANANLLDKTSELELSNRLLQEQAVELEQQTEEAQALTEELEEHIEELRASEVRFRALVDVSAQAVWRSNPEGIVQVASPWLAELTGFTGDAPSKITRQRIVHPADVERSAAVRTWSLQESRAYETEVRIRRADGSYRWFLERAVPVFDESGTTLREWIGSLSDIHDRKVEAEEQQFLLDVSKIAQEHEDPHDLLQAALRCVGEYFNASRCSLLEIDADALVGIGRSGFAWTSAAPAGAERAPMSHLDLTGANIERSQRGETSVITDCEQDVLAQGVRDHCARIGIRAYMAIPLLRGGRWAALLSVSSSSPREWTAREQMVARRAAERIWPTFAAANAHAELAASEARLSGIIGSAMDAIISANETGQIVVFNSAAERVFGVKAPTVMGAALSTFLSTHFRSEGGVPSMRAFATTAHRDLGRGGELSGVRSDGTEFPVEATISRVVVGTGALSTVVMRDLTERRSLEAQLLHAQKMEAVGQLAGGVAHDFNNILTVIRSYADFVRESLEVGDPRRADIEEVLAASDRAAALTRQLLSFSRANVLQPRVLDISDVVSGVEPMLRRLIGEEIAFAVSIHPSRMMVRADLGQLEQVVLNLAVNARDAMPQGGTLTIETDCISLSAEDITQPSPDSEAPLHDARPGDYVVIRVIDSGIGMAPQTLSHIFEPFFTTKADGHGTGLGLATVYGITAQSGGHLRVRSRPNDGSTFEIFLPRLHDAAASEQVPAIDGGARRGSGTILLVDDEVAVRRSVRRMLERAGYTVLEARHGADALLVWREHSGEIDLLLTDMRMPELGGVELVAQLRLASPQLPVISMSGYPPEDADPENTFAASANTHFLSKPFKTDALLSVIERMLKP